jgi:hypothetical protein
MLVAQANSVAQAYVFKAQNAGQGERYFSHQHPLRCPLRRPTIVTIPRTRRLGRRSQNQRCDRIDRIYCQRMHAKLCLLLSNTLPWQCPPPRSRSLRDARTSAPCVWPALPLPRPPPSPPRFLVIPASQAAPTPKLMRLTTSRGQMPGRGLLPPAAACQTPHTRLA